MNAKEAQSLAREACKDEINEIEKVIEHAATEGDTNVQIGSVKGGTINYLKSAGYEIKEVWYGANKIITVVW